MSEQKVEIPNEVGRLDPVTEAIRDGKWTIVSELLAKEANRLAAKADSALGEADESCRSADVVREFGSMVYKTRGEGLEALRRACGWNPDEPAEAQAAGPVVMRVEDLQKDDEIVVSRNYAPEFESFDGCGDLQFGFTGRMRRAVAESLFKRGVEVYRTIDGIRTLISGWPVGEHPAEVENKRLREENERLRESNENLRSDLSWDKLIQPKFDNLRVELEAANSKLAAWQSAANYTPNGTPLAKPVTDPDGQIARLKGMIAASEELAKSNAMLSGPLSKDRVLTTAFRIAKSIADDRNAGSSARCNMRTLAASLESVYVGTPSHEPYPYK